MELFIAFGGQLISLKLVLRYFKLKIYQKVKSIFNEFSLLIVLCNVKQGKINTITKMTHREPKSHRADLKTFWSQTTFTQLFIFLIVLFHQKIFENQKVIKYQRNSTLFLEPVSKLYFTMTIRKSNSTTVKLEVAKILIIPSEYLREKNVDLVTYAVTFLALRRSLLEIRALGSVYQNIELSYQIKKEANCILWFQLKLLLWFLSADLFPRCLFGTHP